MITDEIRNIDFTNNHTWFDIELLCPVNKTNEKENSKFILLLNILLSLNIHLSTKKLFFNLKNLLFKKRKV